MKTLLTSILLCTTATGTLAQSLDDIVSLEVLPGWRNEGGEHVAGLRVTLADGWKTYWRSPGDGGIPPQIALSFSNGVDAASFHWPVPEVFYQDGMRSVGYENSVVVPMTLSGATAQKGISLSGTMTIGVCEEICIPVQFPITAELPPQGTRDSAIVASLIDRPLSPNEAGVDKVACEFTIENSQTALTTTIDLPGLRGDESVVIETGNPEVWVSEPDVTVTAGQITATSDLVHVAGDAFAMDRSQIRITILRDGWAVDLQGCSLG